MPGPRLPILAFVALLSAIVALVGPSAGGHAEAGPLDALCDSLRQRVAEAEATDTAVGIVVADLGTGGRCAVNAHETFRAASLYKLIVLVEAFEQNARGDFSLDEPMVLDPRHFEDDPPALRPAGPLRVSGGEAVRRMVTISDNGAATALVERLDPAALVAAPARLGLTATSLEEPFLTTPADVAQLFSSMYRGDLVSAEASEQMLALLLQQERNDLVPAALPAGSVIAHKTGRIEDYVHDAGIVYAPGGDYVVVLLTRWRESPQQSQRLIRDLAARVHGAFEVAGPPPVQSIVETAPGEPGTLDRALARPPASALAAPAPAAQIAPAAVGGPSAVERPGGALSAPGADASRFGIAGFDAAGFDWSGATPLLLALAAVALVPPLVYGARLRPLLARSTLAAGPAPYARVEEYPIAGGERGGSMRFGTRSNSDDALDEAVDAMQPGEPAGAAGGDSERLERLGAYVGDLGELIEQMRGQVEQEVAPLTELLARQRQTMQRMLGNVEQRLRPLNEYADSEEANLSSLEERLNSEGTEFVWRSFQDYLHQQRQRIGETRERIDEQRRPFLQYAEDRTEAVEVALSRFDNDMDALEANLAEQRKVMMRMLDAMRSESFLAIKEFLSGREATLADHVQGGVTDPAEIAATLAQLNGPVAEPAAADAHLGGVLAATEAADGRLSAAAPSGPRALPAREEPPAADEEQQQEEGAGRSSA